MGALSVVGLSGLAACGGSEATPGRLSEAAPDAATPEAPAEKHSSPDSGGFCDRLSLQEIEAAFGNSVSFGSEPTREDEWICVYSEQDSTGFRTFDFSQRRDIAEHEQVKAQHETSGLPLEPIEGIGIDAYLFNESQLEIRASETEAVVLVAGIAAFGKEPPVGKAEIRRALLELGALLLERL